MYLYQSFLTCPGTYLLDSGGISPGGWWSVSVLMVKSRGFSTVNGENPLVFWWKFLHEGNSHFDKEITVFTI